MASLTITLDDRTLSGGGLFDALNTLNHSRRVRVDQNSFAVPHAAASTQFDDQLTCFDCDIVVDGGSSPCLPHLGLIPFGQIRVLLSVMKTFPGTYI